MDRAATSPATSRSTCTAGEGDGCRGDAHHGEALALAGEAAERGSQLWTTWDVIGETVTLLRYRHSFAAAIGFLDGVRPVLHVADYGVDVRAEAEQVFRRLGLALIEVPRPGS